MPVTEPTRLLDARRITGPNVIGCPPGAVLDIACPAGEQRAAIIKAWADTLPPMLAAMGWSDASLHHREFSGGVALAFSAPTDQLYTAVEVGEWAWAQMQGEPEEDFDAAKNRLQAALTEERNAAWRALEDEAARRRVTCLSEDEEISLGLGKHSQTWAVDELPRPEELDWDRYADVPIALITGTNGKTTTGRLAKKIAQAAGYTVGASSTDGIVVNDRVLDEGDYSGPGGARAVLREQDVDLTILESARGGLLRRGLGVSKANVAVLTNIAEDHLGDFASQNLQELLDVKWVITQAVQAGGGPLVLNADDALLVEQSRQFNGPIIWFSLQTDNALIAEHLKHDGEAFTYDGEQLRYQRGSQSTALCAAADIPLTIKGSAKHNIANALAAAALCHALGIGREHIVTGLCSLQGDELPGRSNLLKVNGINVLVDFAHNAHGVAALKGIADAFPEARKAVMLAQPGDRPNHQITDYATAAWSLNPDRVLISELANYHRGREHGEIFGLIKNCLIERGAPAEQIQHFEMEIQALEEALAWAQPGDLLIVLALDARKAILQRLKPEQAA